MSNRRMWVVFSTLCLILAASVPVSAMHIMEGFLPPLFCVAWGLLCLPFLAKGYLDIQKLVREHRRVLILLAMAGAFVFVLSSLKIPSVTGSSSHPTGTGLAALIFGPWISSILGILVLIFQALLLAHGGLTTLGANTFSMAIAGPFVAFAIYLLGRKMKWNKSVTIFLAATLGDLFTYVVTSFQLAIAYPAVEGGMMASAAKFMMIFAATQVPIAIIEGFLTVAVMLALESLAKSELDELKFFK